MRTRQRRPASSCETFKAASNAFSRTRGTTGDKPHTSGSGSAPLPNR